MHVIFERYRDKNANTNIISFKITGYMVKGPPQHKQRAK